MGHVIRGESFMTHHASKVVLVSSMFMLSACICPCPPSINGSGGCVQSTTTPTAVSPHQDRVNVTTQLTTAPSLIVTLEIDGNNVVLSDAQIKRAPKTSQRAKPGPTLTLSTYNGAQSVGTITITDPIITAQEEGGLVTMEKRSVFAAVPMSTPATEVEVRSSENFFPAKRFDVSAQMDRYCAQYGQDDFCGSQQKVDIKSQRSID
jgi:hypothetical protein